MHASRGCDRAEEATAVRDEREMHRAFLARKVRASAAASGSEAEFVRRARDTGLLVRSRYAKNTTYVIIGYSVAERPARGERPIWFGGGTLATDLRLGQLRQEWEDTPRAAMDAAGEWNAAARNRRKANTHGPEHAAPGPEVWMEYTRHAADLVERLRALPKDDHATWAKAARDASSAFAAWSLRLEPTPGPLAATAAELSRTVQLRAPRDHGRSMPLPSIAGTAMLFLAAASKDKTAAHPALMVQLINTAFTVHEMHAQAGRAREAQRIRAVITQQLAPFTATMPTGAGAQKAKNGLNR